MSELQELLERAARRPSQSLSLETIRRRATGRRRARRARRGIAVVAVLAVAVLSTVWITRRGDEPAVTDQPTRPGTWSTFSSGPLSGRSDAVVAWTGTRMIIWGGGSYGIRRVHGVFSFGSGGPLRPEGAAFDPTRNAWHTIAPSPMGPRARAAAAWTGTELLEWGGRRTDINPPKNASATFFAADGAIYNPTTNRWRSMAPSPLPALSPAASTWTGTELVISGGRTASSTTTASAAYNPRTDSWRVLPPAPLNLEQGTGAWTGTDVVIVGASSEAINGSLNRTAVPGSQPAGTQAMSYNPGTNTWRLLTAPPLVPQSTAAAVVHGTVIAWDYLLHAQRLEPGATAWQPLPNIPLHPLECYTTGLPAGDEVLAISCTRAALLDPSGATWHPFSPPKPFEITEAAWTGSRILFWGLDTSTNPAHTATFEYQPH